MKHFFILVASPSKYYQSKSKYHHETLLHSKLKHKELEINVLSNINQRLGLMMGIDKLNR